MIYKTSGFGNTFVNREKIQKKTAAPSSYPYHGHKETHKLSQCKTMDQDVETDGGASWLKDKRISDSTRRTYKCKVSMMIKVTTPSTFHATPTNMPYHSFLLYIPYHSYLHTIPCHTIPTIPNI